MACDLTCAAKATCFKLGDGGTTCRCGLGYTGNGFTKCNATSPGHLDEHYILMIVLVLLLFVALVVLMIYFLCKRRYGDYTTPLVDSGSETKDPYEEKWDGLFHEMSQRTETWNPDGAPNYSGNVVPPPYNDPSTNMTSFSVGAGGAAAVTPIAEEGELKLGEVDNPTYATVTRDESPDYDNPAFEVDIAEGARPPAPIPEVEVETPVAAPEVEVELEAAPPVEETPAPVVAVAEVEVDVCRDVELTVEKISEDENKITAQIKTPNVTVNLNINVPVPPYVYSSQESFMDKANTSEATVM